MYNEQLETLIDAALADGVLTDKEKQILFKKAQSLGIDLDEFEMVLDARVTKLKAIAPKNNKMGEVKKCPACGAAVSSDMARCPECGYAFSDISANQSSKELASILSKFKGISYLNMEEYSQAITTFPIPNTKADLLEFLTSLMPRIKPVKGEDKLENKAQKMVAKAYESKVEECVNKAKISFPEDPQFATLISRFEAEQKKVKKHKLIKSVIPAIGLFALVLFIMILARPKVTTNYRKCMSAIKVAVQKGNYDKAESLVNNYKGYRIDDGIMYLANAYAEDGNLEKAISIINKAKEPKFSNKLIIAMVEAGRSDELEALMPPVPNKSYIAFDDKDTMEQLLLLYKTTINYYCNNNQLEKARKYALSKSILFREKYDTGQEDYNRKNVLTSFNAIIAQYK